MGKEVFLLRVYMARSGITGRQSSFCCAAAFELICSQIEFQLTLCLGLLDMFQEMQGSLFVGGYAVLCCFSQDFA